MSGNYNETGSLRWPGLPFLIFFSDQFNFNMFKHLQGRIIDFAQSLSHGRSGGRRRLRVLISNEPALPNSTWFRGIIKARFSGVPFIGPCDVAPRVFPVGDDPVVVVEVDSAKQDRLRWVKMMVIQLKRCIRVSMSAVIQSL